MKVGRCKLCLQERELCTRSHIIPKFLYRIISGDNSELVFVSKNGAKSRFSSEYEGDILCENCDNSVIGRLDNYFEKFTYGKFNEKISKRLELRNGSEFLVIENDPNYEYDKYKLFWLTVLWRSSISARPFFSLLKLPDRDAEKIRKMILDGTPGDPNEYAPLLILPPLLDMGNGERGFNKFFMQTMSPKMVEDSNMIIYQFLIQGMSAYIVSTKNDQVKIEPSIELNRLSFRIAKIDEQLEPLRETIEMMRHHANKKNGTQFSY